MHINFVLRYIIGYLILSSDTLSLCGILMYTFFLSIINVSDFEF